MFSSCFSFSNPGAWSRICLEIGGEVDKGKGWKVLGRVVLQLLYYWFVHFQIHEVWYALVKISDSCWRVGGNSQVKAPVPGALLRIESLCQKITKTLLSLTTQASDDTNFASGLLIHTCVCFSAMHATCVWRCPQPQPDLFLGNNLTIILIKLYPHSY